MRWLFLVALVLLVSTFVAIALGRWLDDDDEEPWLPPERRRWRP